jgi:hypothetical protein
MQLNLWSTFDDVREKLSRQYRPMQLAEDTGLTVPDLEAGMRAYLAAHSDEPRIRTKAAILAYLLRNGQVGIDEWDWFADHIGTGRLLWKLQGARALVTPPGSPNSTSATPRRIGGTS